LQSKAVLCLQSQLVTYGQSVRLFDIWALGFGGAVRQTPVGEERTHSLGGDEIAPFAVICWTPADTKTDTKLVKKG
jgi:hypothetical protein